MRNSCSVCKVLVSVAEIISTRWAQKRNSFSASCLSLQLQSIVCLSTLPTVSITDHRRASTLPFTDKICSRDGLLFLKKKETLSQLNSPLSTASFTEYSIMGWRHAGLAIWRFSALSSFSCTIIIQFIKSFDWPRICCTNQKGDPFLLP